MLLSKTQQAFFWSAEKLFSTYDNIYFWTLTFVNVPADDTAAMDEWNQLHRRLVKLVDGIQGLRVAELHRSHGIHFHLFLNKRVPIDRMRRLIRGTGHVGSFRNWRLDFGIMHVKRCDKSPNSIHYLCGYLSKQYREEHNFWGRRRWGPVGGFSHIRKNDVTFETAGTRAQKIITGGRKSSYNLYQLVNAAALIWGEYDNWPNRVKIMMRMHSKSSMTQAEWFEALKGEVTYDSIRDGIAGGGKRRLHSYQIH